MFEVIGYETEEDFNSNRPECLLITESELEASDTKRSYEDNGYWLVTATNEDGKLV